MNRYRMHLMVCGGTGCRSSESVRIVDTLIQEIKKAGMDQEVQVVTAGCFGFCEKGPIVKVYPDNVFYVEVKPSDAAEIVAEHVLKGRTVQRLVYKDPHGGAQIASSTDIPFYGQQIRIALRNCGLIDPESIDEYVSVDGYQALGKCISSMTQQQVVDTLKKSGLRGRGGAGFPTGLKWQTCLNTPSDKKYIICNADEGDPGAFMDRSVLEGDPHSVLEAMAIAGYATGADEGVVYVRAEYPLAVKRLKIAIAQAEEYGLLGEKILGSDFTFHIRLSLGAGAFVCGEETALMNSIEGGRGEPRMKPPFPAERGLFQKPTIINNVETLANVCPILLNGPEWFASIGTEKSKGTKVFALAGKINNVGLAEVPMGITLREIVENIGGGVRNGRTFKAVQTGGPSGGCLPKSMLDIPIDYESLTAAGSMMGSGGMIILDDTDCMVNIAKYYLEFTVDESCGKCTPCRVGNKRLFEILTRITDGKGTLKDLDDLEILGATIRDASLCQLGQTAPNPVLSTLKHFRDEYLAHVVDKRCPSGVCQNLVHYNVIADKCIGCTVCARNCPVSCISGERKTAHVIDQERCIKCGVCFQKCPVDAIVKE
jgi:NADH:ubiquinone oxidoreductase subunit F (NADH-binding)/(2Fe-2S) ferredoxin/Pyruvate/2-oxoacid:ferredoxin oxidoreductase delta subunit